MAKKYFDEVNPKVNFPEIEEKIISFWKENKIFEKSVNQRPEEKKWTFLDGPPFITGMPHYGNLLSGIPKDIFPRFKTMQGYKVRRVWGWDCHGLPAENKVENKLGLKSKKEIEEKIGVKKFIDECKSYVSQVSSEWEWYVDHIGRWVDFKNSYRTMDKDYMETVMWVFKNMYDKGYIYKGLRVSLFCPHCSTPISNFEVAMDKDNYKEITENATTYMYKIKGEEDTYILAWSTTPWNKIATPALAVNPKLKYVKVKQAGKYYILAKSTLGFLKDEPYKIVDEFSGKDLIGKKFTTHYDFYKIDKGKRAFVIIGGDFVTADEGTGVVTIAAYGEDDLTVMQKENIQVVMHVNEEGYLTKDVPNWAGMYYLDVDEKVDQDLEKRGLIYRKESYTHTVPTCWRCQTRLFYSPQDAWYVDIQSLKPELKKTNELVNWYPKHFKYGRFLKSLEAAPDWCISRSRYWGSPVPVWQCECGERFVPGSIKVLEEASGIKILDLHKPEIDEVKVKCKKCGKMATRVPEVLDSWIEAGSASFAERHYPFNKEKLESFFPPDFIVEYTGQIRAWFYVLHVIGTVLFDSNAFKNVVVTGVVLGTDGRKMSKNFGNYPDPRLMLEKYGGDALRLYLMGSPVMHGEDIRISEEEYRNQIKNFLLTLWNSYNFFITYANLDNWKPSKKDFDINDKNLSILDRWILNRLLKTVKQVTINLEKYNTVLSVDALKAFIQDFSTWYIRRSRERIGPISDNKEDKSSFYNTCYFVLLNFSKILAPIAPFVSEEMYKNLTKEESVHLTFWPEFKNNKIDNKLINEMNLVREIVEKIHSERKRLNIPVRQPLNSVEVRVSNTNISESLLDILKKEVNIKNITFKKGKEIKVVLDIKLTPGLIEESKARDLIRKIQSERKSQNLTLNDKVDVFNTWLPENKEILEAIKKKTFTSKLKKGTFKVSKI
ncbi:isoleucine--tRNA ligase [Patescibacteria group bacterium]|nr:isoleucine--tRNA ligase [Patescibacteria group bacterium]